MVSEWKNIWEARYPWPSEDELRAVAIKVCAEYGKPTPEILFRDQVTAWTYHGKRIHMPSLDHVVKHRALDHPLLYRALMLHELAHWILGAGYSHSPKFYEQFFQLCEENGVPLELAFEDEYSYKPKNAPKGLRAYLKSRRGQLAGSATA